MSTKTKLSTIQNPVFKHLCEDAVDAMQALQVPGLALGVVHEGQAYTAGFGVTNIEHPLDVTADTLFQIGSITKTFTATLAMRLVEQGRLDLDAPVRTYLPDFHLTSEDVAAAVTMRHLLTHTGGWFGDYFDDLGPSDDALARMVERVADLPQQTSLGEVWAYNNAGFYVAGRVIEVVTGQTFESAMGDLLLDPLGMAKSFFFARDVITYRFAVGHNLFDEAPEVARPWAVGRAAHPPGGIISSVNDLLRYARFQMGDGTTDDGTEVLLPASMAELQLPQVEASADFGMSGLAWSIHEYGNTKIIGHGGGTNGQVSQLIIAPDDEFALVILTNANRGGQVITQLVDGAQRAYLGIEEPEPEPLKLGADELAEYAGRYTNPMADIEFSVEAPNLVMDVTYKGGFPRQDSPPPPSPPPARVTLVDEDRAMVTEGPMEKAYGEFLRDSDRNIQWLRAGGRLYARLAE